MASSADIDSLSQRAASGRELRVVVTTQDSPIPTLGPFHERVDSVSRLFGDELLSTLGDDPNVSRELQRPEWVETRTPEDFRSQVANYRSALPSPLATRVSELIIHDEIAEVEFILQNPTDDFLEDVELLILPSDWAVAAIDRRDIIDEDKGILPTPPAIWGREKRRRTAHDFGVSALITMPPALSLNILDSPRTLSLNTSVNGRDYLFRRQVGALRPGGTERAWVTLVVNQDVQGQSLQLEWSITAKGREGRATGEVQIALKEIDFSELCRRVTESTGD